jgi:hypothetical protein
MITDLNLFGVFVDAALVTALMAGAAASLLHRLLTATGVYRWVWHPPVVDLALFLLLWLLFALGAANFEEQLTHLIG